VEVIVHDGTTDIRLWPGPGHDRELLEAYGPTFKDVLEDQRDRLDDDLALGEVLRFHPGKLHCNYLLWVATTLPEENGERASAPGVELIEQSVIAALEYARERGSLSVGFGALGDGPGALPPEERLAAVVRAAHRFQNLCFETGRSTGVELVRVCERNGAIATKARRLAGRMASLEQVAAVPVVDAPVAKKRRTTASKTRTSKPRTAAKPKGLSAEEAGLHRASAAPYDRARTYAAGEWCIHPRFGVGCVDEVMTGGAINVRFEDGSVRKMLHGRG
jgi:O-acetyl-ADP-ribose deacetylase (regulator of RNase III)